MHEVHHSDLARGIRVECYPQPLEVESDPAQGRYIFAYTISISNDNVVAVQLLERHWKIYSADQQVAEVVGEGVVGLQPILKPGEKFSYTSSAVIKDPVGAMEGEYTFCTEKKYRFDVAIPHFALLYPRELN